MCSRISNEIIKELSQAAIACSKNAYSPYSHFNVGAALLCKDGTIFKGCNVENISYGATNCAERTAIFKAVSEGYRDFCAIAIYGAYEGKEAEEYAYPCGICRQVMSEFADDDFSVLVLKSEADIKEFKLKDLLPADFNAL